MRHMLLFAVLMAIFGCGVEGPKDITKKNHSRPLEISGLENAPSDKDQVKVEVNASLLDTKFLFQSSVSYFFLYDDFQGLKSRIVRFKDTGSHVVLVEDMEPHSIHNIKQDRTPLASFPVLHRSEGKIHIDFNKGFNNLFVYSDWYASDFSGKQVSPTWEHANLLVSFLKKAETIGDTTIIEQVARTDTSPLRVTYYFTPYKENENFKPKKGTDFRRSGYFETSPLWPEKGLPITYATKFDISKPITFAISANTPEKWRKAVEDGILYWNKAFGKEIIKVALAPEGARAPNFQHNIVQWVDLDLATFAYADAQMDPLTGEILHAQVFFPSGWAISGRENARRAMDIQRFSLKEQRRFAIKGLEKEESCRHRLSSGFQEVLSKMLESNASDQTYHRVSSDYIREVIAHEIGHTLGLRHNFAGSLYSQKDHEKRERQLKYYLEDRLENPPLVSSSVMDYTSFLDAVIIGQGIARGSNALTYDTKAIHALYHNEKIAYDTPLFCTDTHWAIDCQLFDYGPSQFSYVMHDAKQYQKDLPRNLFEAFIRLKSPLWGEAKPVNEINISAKLLSVYLNYHKMIILDMLARDTYLEILAQYPVITDLNVGDLLEKTMARHAVELAKVGGLEKVLEPISKEVILKIKEDFLALLDNHPTGVGPGGVYHFNGEDMEYMRAFIDDLTDILLRDVPTSSLDILDKYAKNLPDHEVFDQLKEIYVKIATKTLLSTQDKDLNESYTFTYKDKKNKSVAITLSIPKFTYSLKARKKAYDLLNETRGEGIVWRQIEHDKEDIFNALKEQIQNSLLDFDTTKMDLRQLPKPLARWVIDNKELLEKASVYLDANDKDSEDEKEDQDKEAKAFLLEITKLRRAGILASPKTELKWHAITKL